MTITVLAEAEDDLQAGRAFYNAQEKGIGEYFAAALAADIESLLLFAGIHSREFGLHCALAKRFPFGIYYLLEGELIRAYAVLEMRRSPAFIRRSPRTRTREGQ